MYNAGVALWLYVNSEVVGLAIVNIRMYYDKRFDLMI
jgi:hypothetical protein